MNMRSTGAHIVAGTTTLLHGTTLFVVVVVYLLVCVLWFSSRMLSWLNAHIHFHVSFFSYVQNNMDACKDLSIAVHLNKKDIFCDYFQ